MGFTGEAIELFNEVKNILQAALSKEDFQGSLKSLRARARNTPSMIMSSGFTQTLVFLASKSISKLYTALCNREKNLGGVKSEDAGYTAYLYVIMRFLSRNKLLAKEPKTLSEVIEAIKELDRKPQYAAATQNILMEFLLEFKKVTEALIEG